MIQEQLHSEKQHISWCRYFDSHHTQDVLLPEQTLRPLTGPEIARKRWKSSSHHPEHIISRHFLPNDRREHNKRSNCVMIDALYLQYRGVLQ